ncbi:DUF4238 domain-containing protein [Sphingomonas suaedae]|uniref:DUF4238 domain-containing protein n=1 Tax=Sphingomonas suaedae TaxID=2599297 RepID=A0A518RHT8_9SPHN|nr:DUF4238 domain-containing protein [Sphingomonas suaedae]QDX27004.1 DUF4238 domain-containing protein [Sphingomonas suaedae]
MDKGPRGGARNHHFVPQYYLKGFATPRSKDGWLSVFDLKEQKSFKTWPRNVAARRDYHRVDIERVDPNIVETQLANRAVIHSALASADRSVPLPLAPPAGRSALASTVRT